MIDHIHDWIRAGLRISLLASAVIAINPEIHGLQMFMSIMSLAIAVRMFAQDGIDSCNTVNRA